MPKRKRKRQRMSRYHTAIHVSPEAGECRHRSGCEKAYMVHLDNDPSVLSYSYEKTVIDYVSNTKTKKMRKYYPDFLIEYADKRVLVEIKPKRKLEQARVQKKLAAARIWSSLH